MLALNQLTPFIQQYPSLGLQHCWTPSPGQLTGLTGRDCSSSPFLLVSPASTATSGFSVFGQHNSFQKFLSQQSPVVLVQTILISQFFHPSVHQSTSQSICESASPVVCQPVHQSINQSVSQSVFLLQLPSFCSLSLSKLLPSTPFSFLQVLLSTTFNQYIFNHCAVAHWHTTDSLQCAMGVQGSIIS